MIELVYLEYDIKNKYQNRCYDIAEVLVTLALNTNQSE